MRLVAALASAVLLGSTSPAQAEEQGPPYDYALGLADAQTGIIGAVMARTGSVPDRDIPAIQTGQTGFVGVARDAPAGRVRAWATVDVAQLSSFDPDAALCIRIWAPATDSRPALPNNVEGGGPVCQFLEGPQDVRHRADLGVFIQTFADLSEPTAVGAEVFVSWKQPHPRETGGTTSLARVLDLGFAPAGD